MLSYQQNHKIWEQFIKSSGNLQYRTLKFHTKNMFKVQNDYFISLKYDVQIFYNVFHFIPLYLLLKFPGLQNKKCQESLILECEDKTEAAGCEDREEFIMNV